MNKVKKLLEGEPFMVTEEGSRKTLHFRGVEIDTEDGVTVSAGRFTR